MKESITLPLEEVIDLTYDAVHTEGSDDWRWGSSTYYVFKKDDKFYGVIIRRQPEQGVRDCNDDPIECQRVVSIKKIVTVTEWIPYQ